MRKGVKFRAYPTREQEKMLARTFGCCRLIYNKGLAMRKEAYAKGEKCGYNQTARMLTALKKEEAFSFLKEADSIALQQTLRDLDTGYTNFYAKRAGYPRFKSKHDHHQSYRTINQKDNIRITGKYLKLPKLGYVKIRQSMEIGKIHNVTIERTATGKYYVVLNVEFEPKKQEYTEGEIGIDVGLKNFYTDSNGGLLANPKYLERSLSKFAKEQKRLSRMKKGSANYEKQRLKVAGIHEQVVNQRNDFLQKASTALINENQVICVEDLRVSNMLKNHKLSRAISSVSWRKFVTMLEYKAEWYGKKVIKVPTFYASSQICNSCGYQNTALKKLSVREWTCQECGNKHERDENAAKNILAKGMEMLAA